MVAENTPLTELDYVCVLKAKRGELQALPPIPKDGFVALMEVPDSSKSSAIEKAWGGSDVIWIQPVNTEELDDADWGLEVGTLLSDLDAAGVLVVPVVTLDEVREVVREVVAAIRRAGRGLVLRLDAEDILTTAPKSLLGEIDDFLHAHGLLPNEIDLVLDASLVRDSVAARIATIESARRSLPYESDWRSLVLAFSAFPTPMGDAVSKNAVSLVPRHDRDAYLGVVARNTGRVPTYADFAVGQPTYGDFPFPAIPNIKYTGVSDWHIHRADSVKNPSPQYVALAGQLASAHHFRGAGFSRGDGYLDGVANGVGGPGNATTYVQVATSHHVHHVLDRLATHGEP